MAKYDVNGDGVFSAEEVRNIVRDLEDTEEKAKNMGRLALAVTVCGLALCLALIGLMYGANEASKEPVVKACAKCLQEIHEVTYINDAGKVNAKFRNAADRSKGRKQMKESDSE